MNKAISTPLVIIIIVVCAVLVVGGLATWYYLGFQKEKSELSEEKQPEDAILKKEISKLLNPENDPDIEVSIVQQEGNFLRGTVGSKSYGFGSWWIAEKIDGKWQIISRHQAPVSCKLLDQYRVPISIESTCVGEDGVSEFNRLDFQRASDAGIKNSMDVLKYFAEIVYDEGSYINLSCQYNKDLGDICRSIKNYINLEPTIHASKDEFCAWIELFLEENGRTKYYCVDNSTASGTTTIYPGEAGYCNGKTFVCPH